MIRYNNIHDIVDPLSLGHFGIYMLLGMVIKNRYGLALMLGILWELFEYIVTTHPLTQQLLITYWPIPQKYWEEKNILNRFSDIMFNMAGYFVGNRVW